jgi:hypothetical protein
MGIKLKQPVLLNQVWRKPNLMVRSDKAMLHVAKIGMDRSRRISFRPIVSSLWPDGGVAVRLARLIAIALGPCLIPVAMKAVYKKGDPVMNFEPC